MSLLNMLKKNRKTKTVIKNEIDYEKLSDAIMRAQKEIDYDKLAEAIVNAQKKANETNNTISKTFGVVICMLLYVVSIAGYIFSIFFAIVGIRYALDSDMTMFARILLIACIVLIFAIILMFVCLLYKSEKELEKEKDRDFLVSLFSAIVCFLAFIISLVALVTNYNIK